MRTNIFRKLGDFLRGKRKMTYQDLNKHWEDGYRVSWNDKFNEAVIHQLKEIPNEYRRIWEEEAKYSTRKFKELQEIRKKQRDKELRRHE